jgi:hypothetical protein
MGLQALCRAGSTLEDVLQSAVLRARFSSKKKELAWRSPPRKMQPGCYYPTLFSLSVEESWQELDPVTAVLPADSREEDRDA